MPSNRQSYYAEDLTESSWNGDINYQDKLSLAFTPDPDSTYLILASWLLRQDNTTWGSLARVQRTNGTPKTFCEQKITPKDAQDYLSGGSISFETFGSSPPQQTYVIQYATNNVAGSAKIKEAKLFALKLVSADQFAQDEAKSSWNTDTSWQTKLTKTFTPSTQGDYIILAMAIMDSTSTSYDWKVELDVDDVSQYNVTNIESKSTFDEWFWGLMKKVNLDAAEHNVSIKYATENHNGTVGIAYANLVILRADEFMNALYAEEDARETTTDTADWIDKMQLGPQTLEAQPYLVIGSCGGDNSANNTSIYMRLLEEAEAKGEMNREPSDTTSLHFPYFSMYKKTFDAAGYTWKIQYHAGTTAGCQDSRIVALELEAAGGPPHEILLSIAISAATIVALQNFVNILSDQMAAQASLIDAQTYIESLISNLSSYSVAEAIQAYLATLNSVAQSVSSITDFKSFVETLQSVAQSSSSIGDFMGYLETLSDSIQSLSSLVDKQTYAEILHCVAQASGSASDLQAYMETIQTVIVSSSQISDQVVGAASEVLLSVIHSISSLADFQNYFHNLLSTLNSLSSISDQQHFLQNLLTLIQSQVSVSDQQAYIDELQDIIVSSAGVTDVLTGPLAEDLLSTILSRAGVYEYYQKPGMVDTTAPFYFDPGPKFDFGGEIPEFYMRGLRPL
jgi:hypothetical protein